MSWAELAAVGGVAGFLAGYLGIGGGLVVVPALTVLFGRNPATAPVATHLAVATSLAAMLFTSLSSIAAHHRRGAVDWAVVGRYVPGLVAGAAAGALLADQLDTGRLAMVFGLFAIAAGLQLLVGKPHVQERPMPGGLARSGIAFAIGGISSMVGIGGGSMTAPWLMWHGVRAQRAVATAAACGYPIAVAGTVAFVLLGRDAAPNLISGYVHLPALAGIVIAGVLTAPLGVAVVHRSDPGRVRKVFGVCLLLVAARMLWP